MNATLVRSSLDSGAFFGFFSRFSRPFLPASFSASGPPSEDGGGASFSGAPKTLRAASSAALDVDATFAGFAAAAVRLLKLSDGDCRSLRSFFRRTDSDRSGKISVPEFIDLIGAKDSSFVRVLIDLMVFEWADLDADDQLNFDELLLAACVVCTLNENELMHVLFKVFDADRSGTVGHREFARLASAIQDLGAMFPGNYMDFIDKFDGDGSGDVDFSEFLNIHRSFPMLFHPILALQDNFRKRTLGVERWKALNMAYVQSQATGIRYNSNNEKAGSVHAMNLTSALRDIGLDDIDQ